MHLSRKNLSLVNPIFCNEICVSGKDKQNFLKSQNPKSISSSHTNPWLILWKYCLNPNITSTEPSVNLDLTPHHPRKHWWTELSSQMMRLLHVSDISRQLCRKWFLFQSCIIKDILQGFTLNCDHQESDQFYCEIIKGKALYYPTKLSWIKSIHGGVLSCDIRGVNSLKSQICWPVSKCSLLILKKKVGYRTQFHQNWALLELFLYIWHSPV